MEEAANIAEQAIEAIEAISIENDQDDFVDPWNVESKSDTGIDYDKLISKLQRVHSCD